MDIKVSVFASAVRPMLWEKCLSSLLTTSVPIEVIFGGPCSEEEVKVFTDKYPFFQYLHTGNIKPAQVYEATRRLCQGETIIWFCDDGEAPNDVIGKSYKYWKSQNNKKLILSIQTQETGYNYVHGEMVDMNIHRFFGGDPNSPLMAPIGLMSREFLEELGGFDRRFICGQYENFAIQLAYQYGATVEIFGGPHAYIDIDHLGKSITIGESTDKESFLKRPFATGFESDRKVLENSWCRFNQAKLQHACESGKRTIYKSDMFDISSVILDKFESYEEKDLLIKSQSNNISERWV